MKYTITINQLGLYYAGLNFKTDWNDWAIIDYLKDFAMHPKSKRIVYKNEEYVWLNYNHLIANLPFAKFQGKWTVSRRIAKLRNLGLLKTYRAKDNTLYVAFTDKLIDICWAKRTDIEKLRRIAGISQNNTVGQGFSPANSNANLKVRPTLNNKEVIHNSATAVAVESNRGCCTNNATAQIVTKYQIVTNNNKDISFSSSFKTKDNKPQINTDEYHGVNKVTSPLMGEGDGEGETKYNTPQPNLLPQGAKEMKSAIKNIKGFKTMSGIWQVVENIRKRGKNNESV